MTALILLDLQNDFLPGGSSAVPNADQVLAVANSLQPCFDLVVATQDWHPAHHGSFADSHAGRQPGDEISLQGIAQILWPRHCVQETWGARLADALDTRHIRRVFTKGTDPAVDSYSGFFDNGYARATGLGDFLRLAGVDEVYILGLATEYCVKHTAQDARKLGFRTYLIADGCRGVERAPGDSERAIEEMRQAGVVILTGNALQTRWSGKDLEPQRIAESKHLQLMRRAGWEFVQRRNVGGVVAIIAVTDEGRLLLVQQHRPPLDATVIELPAGLAGDVPDRRLEDLAEAARRELLEETGYAAADMKLLLEGPSSAGLTDELITFFRATGLTRRTAGGGVDGERIRVREIPLQQIDRSLEDLRRQGSLIDVRVYTGLYLLERCRTRKAGNART